MTLFKPQYFVLLEGSEEDSESGLTPFGRWALPEWLLIGQLDNYSNGPVFTRAGRSRFGLRARQGKAGQGKPRQATVDIPFARMVWNLEGLCCKKNKGVVAQV